VHNKLVDNIISYKPSVFAELELGEVNRCLRIHTVKFLVDHFVFLFLGQVLNVVSDLVGVVHVGYVFVLLVVLGRVFFFLLLFLLGLLRFLSTGWHLSLR